MARARIRFWGTPFHPTLVVFPSALFPLSFLFDAAAMLLREDFWWDANLWILAAGVAGTVVAVVVGLLDFRAVPEGPAKTLARRHRLLGLLVMVWYAAILGLHLADPFDPAAVGWFVVGLNAVGQGLLTFQGHWGGELVYKHRVGVEDEAPPST